MIQKENSKIKYEYFLTFAGQKMDDKKDYWIIQLSYTLKK